MKKKVRHAGFMLDRCRYGLLERIFAESWMHECEARPGINSGTGTLQGLFIRWKGSWSGKWRLVINRRDALVAATVIQWLGTNCGFSFLTSCLRKAGYDVVERERIENDYYVAYGLPASEIRPAYPNAWRDFIKRSREPKAAGRRIFVNVSAELQTYRQPCNESHNPDNPQ